MSQADKETPQEHASDTNVPARSDRICHRQLVNFSTNVDSDCGCQENDCSIYDDKREQCGELTTMQALIKLAGLPVNLYSRSLGISAIMEVYNEENGNKAKTAARLGLTRSTFYRRVAKLGIDEQLGIKRR